MSHHFRSINDLTASRRASLGTWIDLKSKISVDQHNLYAPFRKRLFGD